MTKRSEQVVERARQMLADGYMLKDIAAELRIARQTLSAWLSDGGIREPAQIYWTDERIEALKAHFADGLSYAQIAKRLGGGVTRNAVCGKLHRLGIAATRTKPSKPRIVAPKRVKHTPAQRSWAQGQKDGLSLAVVAQLDPSKHAPREPMPAEDDSIGILLRDLAPHHCRWPKGLLGDQRTFCGDRKAGDGPYCERHHRLSVQPPKPGQARTGNQLMRQLRRYAA